MKHKKLLIVAIVVVAMAVAAAVAYAWWDATVVTPTSTVSTGNVALEVVGFPIDASGLVPQNEPDAEDAVDEEYGDVSYFFVHNTSSIPLMFYGWLGDYSDADNIGQYVNMRVWLLGNREEPDWWTTMPEGWADTFQIPGPHETFFGTVDQLSGGTADGINYLSSRAWLESEEWLRTPINPGEYGVYRVAIWLDSTAPPETQNDAIYFKVSFTGMQEEAWDEADYDSTDFVE